MIVLGLKCYSHDTGAAILSDRAGSLQIIAISEARLNRRKHSFTYPLMSIAYCLDSLGLASLDQVDLICIDRHMEEWPERGSQFGYANALARHHPRYDDNHRWNYLVEQTIKLDRVGIGILERARPVRPIDPGGGGHVFEPGRGRRLGRPGLRRLAVFGQSGKDQQKGER